MSNIKDLTYNDTPDGSDFLVGQKPSGETYSTHVEDLPGGGSYPDFSGAGSPTVRAFPFAFDTPNLLTGAALYTPTVGDVLLDAWFEIDTAWDGTTPLGDIGSFVGRNYGMFSASYDAVSMVDADEEHFGAGLLSQSTNFGVAGVVSTLQVFANAHGKRNVPGKFTTADPIKVCVSQDGTNTGADPGSTQGAAILYLVTVTPV